MTSVRATSIPAPPVPTRRFPSPVPQVGQGLQDDVFEVTPRRTIKAGVNVREHGVLRRSMDTITGILASACRRLWFWARTSANALVAGIKALFEKLMNLLTAKTKTRQAMLVEVPSHANLTEAVDVAVNLQARVRDARVKVALSPAEQAELDEANRACQASLRASIGEWRSLLDRLENRLDEAENA